MAHTTEITPEPRAKNARVLDPSGSPDESTPSDTIGALQAGNAGHDGLPFAAPFPGVTTPSNPLCCILRTCTPPRRCPHGTLFPLGRLPYTGENVVWRPFDTYGVGVGLPHLRPKSRAPTVVR